MKNTPADWEIHPLSHFIEKLESGLSVSAEDVPAGDGAAAVLKVSCVSGGVFYPEENKRILESELPRAKVTVRKGTILISRSNTQEFVGESAYVNRDYPNLFLSDKTWQTTFRQDARLDARWLGYVLASPSVKKRIGNISNGTSGSLKNISKESFLSLEVITPPTIEQAKIANILSCWDQAIELIEKLIAAESRLKRGLIRRLLTGKKRFAEFCEQKWRKVSLNEICEINRSALSNKTDPDFKFFYLDISSVGKGKVSTPASRIRFKDAPSRARRIVRRNDILISTVRPNLQAFARFTDEADDIIASTGFAVITAKSGADAAFVYHSLFSAETTRQINALIAGTNYPAINPSQVGALKLSLPQIDEQRRIATALNAFDRKLSLLRQELAALKRQKKGLMHKLLTGKIRVNVAVDVG
ncbi:MAG TPA: restriction endonuclease subunit S [Blastocatellia bacterium]|nr:restriction endonuclease subunit S [Blastocatellia bacterium]